MNVIRLNERFERIERAYVAALEGREAASLSVIELMPVVFAAVPDTTAQEIAEALRWSARKDLREADELEKR